MIHQPIVRRGSGLLTISNHSSEDLYADVIGVVWCGYSSTLHQAMNQFFFFFHGFVGGKMDNRSIFAYNGSDPQFRQGVEFEGVCLIQKCGFV